jgi:hypothetical protein
VWPKRTSPRPKRAAGGYSLAQTSDGRKISEASDVDDVFVDPAHQQQQQELQQQLAERERMDRDGLPKMALPPRYRFRDLLLGDFAFNDDGER